MKKLIIVVLLFCVSPSFAADYYPAATATDQIRMILPETTSRYFTDTEIENWIQEATEDISTRALCIQDTDTITLSTDTYEYTALDTAGAAAIVDVVKVWGCIYENPDDEYIGLKRIEPWQIADLMHMQAGPPVYYYHFADTIGVLPIPSSSENGDTIKVYYSKQSQTIGDLPNEYQSLTFWYVAAMALGGEQADKYYQMYLEKLKSLRSDLYNVKLETK